ncbi:MAG TPA: class I SAM-dependent methyltransferase [Chthoniobacteraceae bacterium]|jgi:ubiquinone/menaquinone biosynthesis C-methylase UbiE|nr:class I SAM-dependent methyltransferase [Chthoniobacteraceae bacterium]
MNQPGDVTPEEREARFWDEHAQKLSEADLRVEVENVDTTTHAILSLMPNLESKRVLDVGCGTGDWAVRLARKGAEVCAVDISPESVAVTRRRAAHNEVAGAVHAAVMSATELEFPDDSFDFVHGQDIIHHLDGPRFGAEIARVLRPGGIAVFHENSANNPLLMFARNHLCGRFGIPRWSSEDEYPLTEAKLKEFGRPFRKVEVTYPEFRCFFYLDAKLFHYRNRFVSTVCRGLDGAIYRFLPFLRRYSYRQLIACER